MCFGLFNSNLRTILPNVYGLIMITQCWLPVVFGPLLTFVILRLPVYILVFVYFASSSSIACIVGT